MVMVYYGHEIMFEMTLTASLVRSSLAYCCVWSIDGHNTTKYQLVKKMLWHSVIMITDWPTMDCDTYVWYLKYNEHRKISIIFLQ